MAAALALVILLIAFSNQLFPSSTSPFHPAAVSLLTTTWHDHSCFTQGLEFIDPNTAVESCGLYGESRIQLLDFTEHHSNSTVPPRVIKRLDLRPQIFAEGITLANGLLYLLTWREKVLVVVDPKTLIVQREIPYPTEGWGIAYRKSTNTFLATSGSNYVYHLAIDVNRVTVVKKIPVVCDGVQLHNLNELELVGNDLFANVWQTDKIYRINPDTGACLSVYDLGYLPRDSDSDVLNGIASHGRCSSSQPLHSKSLWVTGKQWKALYCIEIAE